MILVMFLVAHTAAAQPLRPALKPMPDYYFVGEKDLNSGVNCIVVTSRKQMEKLFGRINRPDTPDFSRELLLVMVMPATKKDPKLAYRSTFSVAGNFVEVYCDINYTRKTVTYIQNPIAVAVIPRYPNVTKVNFYDERRMRLLSSVPVPGSL
jgi:hypothetical protein